MIAVFALLAVICFVLVVFKVTIGVNLVALGLAFVATHLLLGGPAFYGLPWKRG